MSLRTVGSRFGRTCFRQIVRAGADSRPGFSFKEAIWSAAGKESLTQSSPSTTWVQVAAVADPLHAGVAYPLIHRLPTGQGYSSGGASALIAAAALSSLFGIWVVGPGSASATDGGVSPDDPDEELPESVDWEASGAVNIPQEQGDCGSCWAHSGIGTIEGIHKIKWKKLPRLSVQQVIDCATRNLKTGTVKGQGCRGGGYIHEAYDHVMKYGSVAEKSYPLRWFWGHGKCRQSGMEVVSVIHGYRGTLPTEKDLMRAVAKQPVAVYVYTCPPELRRSYSGWLIEPEEWPALDGKDDLPRHAVVVVGYGKDDNGNLFWKIKNSYGITWGDRGYGYLRRGIEDKRGVAGITKWPGFYPVILQSL